MTDDTVLDEIDSSSDATLTNSSNLYDELKSSILSGDVLDDVGNDSIEGEGGDDLIYGDALFTDTLAAEYSLGLEGAGWEVFGILENPANLLTTGTDNHQWIRTDTIEYIETHQAELAQESTEPGGDPRDGSSDILDGDAGADVIFGQEDDDTITGGAAAEPLDDHDNLVGGTGLDTISGGADNDLLVGDEIKVIDGPDAA